MIATVFPRPQDRVNNPDARVTPFNEELVAERRTIFSLRPTWGTSIFRDRIIVTGSGSTVVENGGELEVRAGAATNAVAQLRTAQRGQYAAGLVGEWGVALRVPNRPTGSQVITWGYFDDQNGFGYRYDNRGMAVFRRRNGVDEIVYQDDWNIDILKGDGTSGTALRPDSGVIYQCVFTWYGYGSIEFSVQLGYEGNTRRKTECHRFNVDGNPSIVDPNQPLTVRVDNGSSSNTALSAFVGGRQFSIVGGSSVFQERRVSEKLVSYSLPAAWTPLIALREKSNFSPSSRPNSVSTVLRDVQVLTSDTAEFKVVYGGTITGTFFSPSEVPAAETACETIVQSGTLGHTGGVPVARFGTPATTPQAADVSLQEQIQSLFIDNEDAVTVLGRNLAGGGNTVSVFMTWNEQW